MLEFVLVLISGFDHGRQPEAVELRLISEGGKRFVHCLDKSGEAP